MDTSTLSSLYSSDGPFATVLIDVSRDNENGDQEHDLRVRAAACEQLRTQGADERVIGNVRRGLSDATDLPAPVARLVVASAEGVPYQRTRDSGSTRQWQATVPFPTCCRGSSDATAR